MTEAESRRRRCAHPACACEATEGDWCSAYCANVDVHEDEEAACACGHAACNAAERVGASAGTGGTGEASTSIGPVPPDTAPGGKKTPRGR